MERLLRPKSIAVVGGGEWCKAVIAQNKKIGFEGEVWHVHPTAKKAFRSIEAVPGVPDAVFIGVNREATVDVVKACAARGVGGVVCFASGFEEVAGGADINQRLLDAAGDMPILGPNCYGLINGLDKVALWPDQHGVTPVDKGVALIAQSSNIAINLTMQQRGLPIAYVMTAGNQAQQTIATMALAAVRDPRVTALGLYIESFADIRGFERLAKEAEKLGKPIVALKVGQSAEAQRTTVTHTASMAGTAIGAELLMSRLGIASVDGIAPMLETLKLFHCFGRLPGTAIASLSCSGGEASLVADAAARAGLTFPDLDDTQSAVLSGQLGPRVTVSNPLDYHTDIWRNIYAMTSVFSAMTGTQIDLTVIVLDFPHPKKCKSDDWMLTLEAIERAAVAGGRFAVLASLPENLPQDVCERLMKQGIAPLCDIDHACGAIRAASTPGPGDFVPVLPAPDIDDSQTLTEGNSKKLLAEAGLDVPHFVAGMPLSVLPAQAMSVGFPLVLKAEGQAHKSEDGGVVVGLTDTMSVTTAARAMDADSFLIETMVQDGITELMIGVVADPAHGFVLTLAAGGVMTELFDDTQSLLLPVDQNDVLYALARLRISDVLRGYRGKPGVHIASIVQAVLDVQDFITANADNLAEVEINPLICTDTRAVVADALIVRKTP